MRSVEEPIPIGADNTLARALVWIGVVACRRCAGRAANARKTSVERERSEVMGPSPHETQAIILDRRRTGGHSVGRAIERPTPRDRAVGWPPDEPEGAWPCAARPANTPQES